MVEAGREARRSVLGGVVVGEASSTGEAVSGVPNRGDSKVNEPEDERLRLGPLFWLLELRDGPRVDMNEITAIRKGKQRVSLSRSLQNKSFCIVDHHDLPRERAIVTDQWQNRQLCFIFGSLSV